MKKCLRIQTTIISKAGIVNKFDSCYWNNTSIPAMGKAVQEHGKGFTGRATTAHEVIPCWVGCTKA